MQTFGLYVPSCLACHFVTGKEGCTMQTENSRLTQLHTLMALLLLRAELYMLQNTPHCALPTGEIHPPAHRHGPPVAVCWAYHLLAASACHLSPAGLSVVCLGRTVGAPEPAHIVCVYMRVCVCVCVCGRAYIREGSLKLCDISCCPLASCTRLL